MSVCATRDTSVRARVWYGPGRWWRRWWMGGMVCVECRGDGGASNGAPVARVSQTAWRGVESVEDGGKF